MNLLKLQDQLKGLPDEALIRYVQNPSGQVPTYLALSELERRKTMRAQYQAEATEAPETTVASDLTQSSAPQGGVSQLDTGDMFREQNYASGGIVAFADGGSTDAERFRLADEDMFDKWMRILRAPVATYNPEGLKNWSKNIVDFQNPFTASEYEPYEVGKRRAAEANKPVERDPAEIINEQTNPKRFITPIDYNKIPESPAPIEKKTKDKEGSSVTTPAPAGLKALYEQPEDMASEFEKQLRSGTSAEAAMERYNKLLGKDEGRAKMEAALDAMEQRAAKEGERAPWMALARAGLGMAAGRSPFALQNIAAGGIEGLTDYAAAKDRLEKAAERRFDLQSRIAQAQRAEKVAAATYGINSEERDRAHNEAVKLQQLNYKAQRAENKAAKDFEANKFNIEQAMEGKKLDITAQHYKDWYNVNLMQAEKSLQGIEKQTKQQQTAILNNLLDETVRQQKAAQDAMDDKQATALQAKIDAIQKRMYELTGVNIPQGPTTPTGPRAKPLSAFGK